MEIQNVQLLITILIRIQFDPIASWTGYHFTVTMWYQTRKGLNLAINGHMGYPSVEEVGGEKAKSSTIPAPSPLLLRLNSMAGTPLPTAEAVHGIIGLLYRFQVPAKVSLSGPKCSSTISHSNREHSVFNFVAQVDYPSSRALHITRAAITIQDFSNHCQPMLCVLQFPPGDLWQRCAASLSHAHRPQPRKRRITGQQKQSKIHPDIS